MHEPQTSKNARVPGSNNERLYLGAICPHRIGGLPTANRNNNSLTHAVRYGLGLVTGCCCRRQMTHWKFGLQQENITGAGGGYCIVLL